MMAQAGSDLKKKGLHGTDVTGVRVNREKYMKRIWKFLVQDLRRGAFLSVNEYIIRNVL